MTQTLYVVMGTTGEYSDRSEWPVRAFIDETAAETLAVLATARAKEIEDTKGNRYSSIPDGANEHDQQMQMDYTGTKYYIMTVPLDDTVRAAIAVTVQDDVAAGLMRAISLGPLLPH